MGMQMQGAMPVQHGPLIILLPGQDTRGHPCAFIQSGMATHRGESPVDAAQVQASLGHMLLNDFFCQLPLGVTVLIDQGGIVGYPGAIQALSSRCPIPGHTGISRRYHDPYLQETLTMLE